MLDSTRIEHILRAADRIAAMAAEGRQVLESDEKHFDSVRMQLATIGEATPKLSDRFHSRHPEVRFEELERQRHRIIHEYFIVDYDLLWELMTVDTPALATSLRAALLSDPTIQ